MLKQYFIKFHDTKDGDIILRANKIHLPSDCVIDFITVNPEKDANSKNTVEVPRIIIDDFAEYYTINMNKDLECFIVRTK